MNAGMSRRQDLSFTTFGTLEDFRRDESTRKRATTSLQSGGTVLDEFSSASDFAARHDDDVDSKKDLPRLPNGNSRLCCVLSVCVFVCCCITPASLIGIAYLLAPDIVLGLLPASLRTDPVAQANARAVKRDESIKDYIEVGIWDSKQSITPLQLQVAISIALGVRVEDEDIEVKVQQNRHFFEVTVSHGTQEELAHIESDVFLASLNVHLVQFGGNAVVTHSPLLVKAGPVPNVSRKHV
jgi:hypothetical protein